MSDSKYRGSHSAKRHTLLTAKTEIPTTGSCTQGFMVISGLTEKAWITTTNLRFQWKKLRFQPQKRFQWRKLKYQSEKLRFKWQKFSSNDESWDSSNKSSESKDKNSDSTDKSLSFDKSPSSKDKSKDANNKNWETSHDSWDSISRHKQVTDSGEVALSVTQNCYVMNVTRKHMN